MGLFGRKLKLDDELAGQTPAVAMAAGEEAAGEEAAATLTPVDVLPVAEKAPAAAPASPAAAQKAPATAPASPAAASPARAGFTFDDLLKLARSLPLERNSDLVLRVMKQTLESVNVRVADLVAEADRREAAARDEMETYKSHIAELEGEIQIRREEIKRLEGEIAEAATIKQRLRGSEPHGAAKVVALG